MPDSTNSSTPGDKPHASSSPAPKTEREVLEAQAAAAREAMNATWGQLRANVGQSADIAAWARKYPWPTVGVAAAAGFLAASAVFGRRENRDDLSAAMADAWARQAPPAAAPPPQRSAFASLLSELLMSFAGGLQAAIVSAISAKMQTPPPAEPSTNGHDSPTAAGADGP